MGILVGRGRNVPITQHSNEGSNELGHAGNDSKEAECNALADDSDVDGSAAGEGGGGG